MTNDQLKQQYLDEIRKGKGPITAARAIGSTQAMMNEYLAMDLLFAEQVDEARAEALEAVEAKVFERATEGDLGAAKMILESHLPDKWTRPDKDMILRLGRIEEDIDIAALHARLEAAQQVKGELPRAEET